MRIEICGGIASGKTTLTSMMQKYLKNSVAVHEDITSSCFLDDFYKNPQYYAFETEIAFLLQHLHQIKAVRNDVCNIICDYSLEQDFAYASSNLSDNAFHSFAHVYHESINQIKAADIIIFLECPADVMLNRITARGNRSEQEIDANYLAQTVKCLKSHLQNVSSFVLYVDSRKYDFRDANSISSLLSGPLMQIQRMVGLR